MEFSKIETINKEFKSLKKVQTPDGKLNNDGLNSLSTTCVCLANAIGGEIYIGIEDHIAEPPPDQRIDDLLINKVIASLQNKCFNVGLTQNDIQTHPNGGQYFVITVHPSSKSIATTADGKIYIRTGDHCQPVKSEEIIRLATEKDAFQWELQKRAIKISDIPLINITQFAQEIRNSNRVKETTKNLSDLEIAEHYNLIIENRLTNLGILWLGNKAQRTQLAYPITIQYIVYDELERKIRKLEWNNQDLNPKQILIEIEKQATELQYFDELPNGLFRNQIRHYDARLIRELFINALAHKTFTISGDIFIKVYNNRLEVSNPGGLPLGITPENILHKTHRRNPNLIRILHDIELMEGEGTGYNLMYEITSRDAKDFPIIETNFSTTTVTQYSKIQNQDTIILLDFIAQNYQLSQKEFTVLGVIARETKILSTQLSIILQLPDEDRLRTYVQKLVEQSILISRGIKKGTEYLINPKLIQNSKINIKPTLKTIEQPRLKALIEEVLKISPNLSMAELHIKLGDVDIEDVRKAVYKLVNNKTLNHRGGKTFRTYHVAK